MKNFSVVAGTILAATGLAMAAPAYAAPSTQVSAADVVSQLRSQGNTVILSRVGTGGLGACTVHQVRSGQTLTHFDRSLPGTNHPASQVTSMTVYVDLDC